MWGGEIFKKLDMNRIANQSLKGKNIKKGSEAMSAHPGFKKPHTVSTSCIGTGFVSLVHGEERGRRKNDAVNMR